MLCKNGFTQGLCNLSNKYRNSLPSGCKWDYWNNVCFPERIKDIY